MPYGLLQMLADILTIVEHRGSFEGMKLAFVGYGSDPSTLNPEPLPSNPKP